MAPPTAAAIRSHLAKHLAGLSPTVVVLFSSLPGEVDVGELARDDRHQYGLTRTPDTGWLTIHSWDSSRELHPYGFSQPVANAPQIDLEDVGVVVVPGLAFDRRGIRLGRGAGYYDELFSRLPDSVLRVGVCPKALVVDQLPAEPHDIAMHLLATEEGIRRC